MIMIRIMIPFGIRVIRFSSLPLSYASFLFHLGFHVHSITGGDNTF